LARTQDLDYIGVAWNAPGPPEIALAHEYAHYLFREDAYPLWFREGIAEYLARTSLGKQGVEVGQTDPVFVASLLNKPWLPLEDLLEGGSKSGLLAHANFYPQCWVLVHWLAARAGHAGNLLPGLLERELRSISVPQLGKELRAYLQRPLEPVTIPAPQAGDVRVTIHEPAVWELPFWIADLRREMGLWDTSRAALRALERDHPAPPEISAALGALEMDTGHYGEAERALKAAIDKGAMDPRTHYRYALVLMHPVDPPDHRRSLRASYHARRARAADPAQPLYRLAGIQALLLNENWEAAAVQLRELAALPGWWERAEVEFGELERRRQLQLMRSLPPAVAEFPEPSLLPLAQTLDVSSIPPPPLREPDVPPSTAAAWPPAGSVQVKGRLVGVECNSQGKIVTFRTSYGVMRLRESSDQPIRLLWHPLKWKILPCDASGWVAEAVYRAAPVEDAGVRGVLLALVF
jgi:hypothetical protein